jgi:hypothetical protein
MTVDGGGSRDLVTFDVRGAGFGTGSPITVDLGRGVLRTEARAGRVRSLEVLWIRGEDARWRVRGTPHNDDLIMQGGRSLEAVMRGGRDSVVATRGPDVLDLGTGRGDFANGRRGRDTCLGAERVVSCENRSSGTSGLSVVGGRWPDVFGGSVGPPPGRTTPSAPEGLLSASPRAS